MDDIETIEIVDNAPHKTEINAHLIRADVEFEIIDVEVEITRV